MNEGNGKRKQTWISTYSSTEYSDANVPDLVHTSYLTVLAKNVKIVHKRRGNSQHVFAGAVVTTKVKKGKHTCRWC